MKRAIGAPVLAVALLALAYIAVQAPNLTVVPPVHEDEPWQASTGLKLAREGVFGSDLFAGTFAMERRHYCFPPVHPLLLAATFRLAGYGLLQARAEAVACGLAVLLLTYLLGRTLFSPVVGAIAAGILLLVRTAGTTPTAVTGILLLDTARIARYDILVPVFGLAALLVFVRAERRQRHALYFVSGLLAGFAALSHVYGAFWIVALGALCLSNRAGWRRLGWLVAGFAAPVAAYALYVLGDVEAFLAQTHVYGPRFDLANPGWYLANLLAEPRRWGPGLPPLGPAWLARPGLWAWWVAVPASLTVLAARGGRGDRDARAVAVPALLLPALFALLLSSKTAGYLATLVPLLAVAAAWGAANAWRAAAQFARRRTVRAAIAALGLAVAAEGAARIVALHRAVAAATPFGVFAARLRQAVPATGRVLVLHRYAFALAERDVVSWAAPIFRADPRTAAMPVPIARALDDVAPDVVLIDPRMRDYLVVPATSDPLPAAIRAWLAACGYARRAVVEDPTYGPVEVLVSGRR